jgi:hypothetical protein
MSLEHVEVNLFVKEEELSCSEVCVHSVYQDL